MVLNKKIFIWMIGLILLSSFVLADTNDDLWNKLESGWSLDEDSGAFYDIKEDVISFNESNYLYNQNSILGEAPFFNQSDNGYIDFDNTSTTIKSGLQLNYSTYTINLWFNATTDPNNSPPSGNDRMLICGNYINDPMWALKIDSNNKDKLQYYTFKPPARTLNTIAYGSNTAWDINTWYMVTVIFNGTHIQFYLNGVADGTPTATETNGYDDFVRYIRIGNDATNVMEFDGLIDEVYIFNDTISQTEIDYLYNSGSGNKVTEPVGEDITLPTITDYKNFTIDEGDSIASNFNATDDVGIDEWWVSDVSNFKINNSGYFENNTELVPGSYPVTVYVNDTSNNIDSKNVTVYVNLAFGRKIFSWRNMLTSTDVGYMDESGNLYVTSNLKVEGCIQYNGGILGTCV